MNNQAKIPPEKSIGKYIKRLEEAQRQAIPPSPPLPPPPLERLVPEIIPARAHLGHTRILLQEDKLIDYYNQLMDEWFATHFVHSFYAIPDIEPTPGEIADFAIADGYAWLADGGK